MRQSWWLSVVCCLIVSGVALACKYTIRDVGFVDLEPAPYQLLVVTATERPQLVKEIEPLLRDSNVQPVFCPLDQPIPAAQTYLAKYRLADQPLPVAVLVGPGDRSRLIPLAKAVDKQGLADSLKPIITSPKREKLLEAAMAQHSVILLVEGENSAINRQASQLATQAIEEIKASLPFLPKPIANPPVLMTITPEEAKGEAILLWSLGLGDRDPQTATLAVLFGRCRRLDKVLTVPGGKVENLLRPLHLVGQDCECNLDRDYMRGLVLPHHWDASDEQEAVRALGFDPGNPLVQAEIRQILAKRPPPGQAAPAVGMGIVPGYQEFDLDATPEASKPTETINRSEESPPPPATIPMSKLEAAPSEDKVVEDGTEHVAAGDAQGMVRILGVSLAMLLAVVVAFALLIWILGRRRN